MFKVFPVLHLTHLTSSDIHIFENYISEETWSILHSKSYGECKCGITLHKKVKDIEYL